MRRASKRAKETQHFVNFHPVEFSGKKKHDLDVATDSIKLLRAQTEASSSYPVLFFSIPLSVVWRLTCKAVHKQNGFQLSFRCFGLDLNKMRFVFAHMYAWVCVYVRVCVHMCARVNTQHRIFPHQDVSYLWISWLCKVTHERVRGAGQNVSLGALTCVIP